MEKLQFPRELKESALFIIIISDYFYKKYYSKFESSAYALN